MKRYFLALILALLAFPFGDGLYRAGLLDPILKQKHSEHEQDLFSADAAPDFQSVMNRHEFECLASDYPVSDDAGHVGTITAMRNDSFADYSATADELQTHVLWGDFYADLGNGYQIMAADMSGGLAEDQTAGGEASSSSTNSNNNSGGSDNETDESTRRRSFSGGGFPPFSAFGGGGASNPSGNQGSSADNSSGGTENDTKGSNENNANEANANDVNGDNASDEQQKNQQQLLEALTENEDPLLLSSNDSFSQSQQNGQGSTGGSGSVPEPAVSWLLLAAFLCTCVGAASRLNAIRRVVLRR